MNFAIHFPDTFATRLATVCVTIACLCSTNQAGALEPIEVFTEPYQTIEVAAAEPGILNTINVQQGDFVQAGEIVAALNRDVLLASMEIAKLRANMQSQLKKTRADVNQKRRRYQKLTGLHQNGHASEEEIDSAQTNLEIAEAGLLEATEAQKLAKLQILEIEAQLRQREIRSPINGQVVKLQKDKGEYVASIEPVVAKIVQLDKLRVKFYVDTNMARSVRKGDTLPLLLVDTNRTVNGSVEFVSPTTNADSRTVRIEVVIENPNNAYRSGVPVRLNVLRQARR